LLHSQGDTAGLYLTIFLYIGAIGLKNNGFQIANKFALHALSSSYIERPLLIGTEQAVEDLFVKNDIKPIIWVMENQGPFTVENPCSIKYLNDEAIHTQFTTIINLKYRMAEFEQRVARTDPTTNSILGYADVICKVGCLCQIVEWKYISVNFVSVAGCDNKPYLCEQRPAAAMDKINRIKKMSESEILQLKVVSFDRFNSNKSVQQLLDTALQQAEHYAGNLEQCKTKAKVVHAAVAVACSRIVCKTKHLGII